jgi:biotin transport system ATP-binding protein
MITVDGLTHRFGEVTAIDSVSVTIADGAFVVLAGANGSGKTTLVRHFNGLLAPDEGSVTVDGQDVQDRPVAARTSVGMVFQRPRDQFVAATIGADVAFGPENLGLERAEIDRRVETALAAVNMDGRETGRIDELSGGEQARVAIAGALAMEPSHLVLDEPFAGLDQPARESVLAHLDELQSGGTGIVVVTHDLRDLLTRADRLLAMRDGELVVDTPPERAGSALADVDVRVPAS